MEDDAPSASASYQPPGGFSGSNGRPPISPSGRRVTGHGAVKNSRTPDRGAVTPVRGARGTVPSPVPPSPGGSSISGCLTDRPLTLCLDLVAPAPMAKHFCCYSGRMFAHALGGNHRVQPWGRWLEDTSATKLAAYHRRTLFRHTDVGHLALLLRFLCCCRTPELELSPSRVARESSTVCIDASDVM